VGSSDLNGNGRRGFRTSGNSPITPNDDLGALSGTFSVIATAINNSRAVTGTSGASRFSKMFRTAPHRPIDPDTDDIGSLSSFPSSEDFANAINDSGQVVGQSPPPNSFPHAFRTAPNATINPAADDLGTLAGLQMSSALALNNDGWAVGFSGNQGLAVRAFLYVDGPMLDLNDLIPSDSGWILHSATGINNLGQIVGFGEFNGIVSGFRLDPVQ
jgi:probable HAF family extracellular repeat protein